MRYEKNDPPALIGGKIADHHDLILSAAFPQSEPRLGPAGWGSSHADCLCNRCLALRSQDLQALSGSLDLRLGDNQWISTKINRVPYSSYATTSADVLEYRRPFLDCQFDCHKWNPAPLSDFRTRPQAQSPRTIYVSTATRWFREELHCGSSNLHLG